MADGQRSEIRHSRVFGVALAATLLLLAGCAAPPVPIKVDDSHASSGAIRATWRFADSNADRAREGSGVEVGASRYRGQGTQSLANGEYVSLGTIAANGPATLRNDATVRHAYLALTHINAYGSRLGESRAKNRFELEFLGGIGVYDLALGSVAMAAASAPGRYTSSTWGVLAGVGLRVWLVDYLALESRWTLTLPPEGLVGANAFGTAEYMVAYYPVRNLALRVGYVNAGLFESGPGPGGSSRVTLDLGGAHVGLGLEF